MRIRQSPFGCSQYSLLAAATALMLSSQTGLAKDRMLPTKAGPIKVKTIAKGLQNPWGFAFLPDGQMLVTERPGRLRLVSKDGAVSKPLTGVPAIDPDFKIEPPRLFLLCGARRGRGFDRGGAWEARRGAASMMSRSSSGKCQRSMATSISARAWRLPRTARYSLH